MSKYTFLAMALMATSAVAGETTITVSEPWARETAASAKVGGSYMVISNSGDQADRLIAGTSPAASRIELHTHIKDGDVMRMREVEGGIEIPANGVATLAPGNLHVMLIGLTEPLSEGSQFPVTLTFEQAGEITITVDVKDIAHGITHKH